MVLFVMELLVAKMLAQPAARLDNEDSVLGVSMRPRSLTGPERAQSNSMEND